MLIVRNVVLFMQIKYARLILRRRLIKKRQRHDRAETESQNATVDSCFNSHALFYHHFIILVYCKFINYYCRFFDHILFDSRSTSA